MAQFGASLRASLIATESAALALHNSSIGQVRILIADDYAEWRLKLREIVDHEWDIIGEACEGLEAVVMAAQLRPDIVILDISMPRMNGIEAARRIRQESPSTGIVFFSENTSTPKQVLPGTHPQMTIVICNQ